MSWLDCDCDCRVWKKKKKMRVEFLVRLCVAFCFYTHLDPLHYCYFNSSILTVFHILFCIFI
ncbi:hypothetical protein HanRHA438_Chr04g0198271 [Helianthus annuus]|nr:hypothetical protein HanRHA438_Chr04g0198271 [Helianthus annuus]